MYKIYFFHIYLNTLQKSAKKTKNALFCLLFLYLLRVFTPFFPLNKNGKWNFVCGGGKVIFTGFL